jgi:hypothetical protein
LRIFYAFLILLTSVLLWFIPVTDLIYDFRTDVRNDDIVKVTNASETSANVTLHTYIYGSDATLASVTSDEGADAPVIYAYAPSNHTANITGLSVSLSRILTVTYDVDALSGSTAWDKILDDIVPKLWLLIIIIFPIAALVAMFLGRA